MDRKQSGRYGSSENYVSKEKSLPYTDLENLLRKLSSAIEFYDLEKIKELFMEAPQTFNPAMK